MIELNVKGWKQLRLEHLVLDLNGTLSLDGELLPGVATALAALQPQVHIHLLSADTLGKLDAIAAELGVVGTRLAPDRPEPRQKAEYIATLDEQRVAVIGNGANDVGMLRTAALAVAVLGSEGLSAEAARTADILVGSIEDGLGLLLHPRRIVATLRR